MKHIDLNFDWKLKYVDDQLPLVFDAGGGKQVDLPDDFVINLPRSADVKGGPMVGYFPSVQGKYSKKVMIPAEWQGRKVLLSIDGAYMNMELMVDGERLDMHPYGYTPHVADLTEELAYGKENTFTINTQSRQPSSRWYSGGGLYRSVELLVGEPCYLDPRDLFVTTVSADAETAVLHVSAGVRNIAQEDLGGTVTVLLRSPDGELLGTSVVNTPLRAGTVTAIEQDITVIKPELWSCDHPALYEIEVRVGTPQQADDVTTLKTGIRQIEITPEKGLLVNGEPVKLRGGCIHHDNGMLGAKAFPRAEERKIALLKEAGYNAIRTAHNPPSAALLDACDRLGMLVLDEAFDCWRSAKNALDYHLYFEDWHERDLTAMVLRDRNHPSVFCWSCGNEIAESNGSSHGEKWLRRLMDILHRLDPSRPATCGGMFIPAPKATLNFDMGDMPPMPEFDEDNPQPMPGLDQGDRELPDQELLRRRDSVTHMVDVISVNYAYQDYARYCEEFPDRAILGTETMGFYSWENWAAVNQSNQVLGDFIWTAIDNLGEAGAGCAYHRPEDITVTLMGDYPWLSCYQGDLDLTGRRLPRSYYRSVMWGLDRGIYLFTIEPKYAGKPVYGIGWHWPDMKPTWTFREKDLGKDVEVIAYCDCDEVRFYHNDALIAAVRPERMTAKCMIPYAPGVIRAVGIRNGEAACETELVTACGPVRLRLTPDRSVIRADGMDLSFISIDVTDAAGVPIMTDQMEVSVHCCGAGVLEGLGSGNPCTPENYGTGRRRVYRGGAMAAIRAAREPGEITVTVTCDGLPAAAVTLRAE